MFGLFLLFILYVLPLAGEKRAGSLLFCLPDVLLL